MNTTNRLLLFLFAGLLWTCSDTRKGANNDNVREGGVCACDCPDGSAGWEYCPDSDGCHCADMGDIADMAVDMSLTPDDFTTTIDEVLQSSFAPGALEDPARCVSGVAVVVTPNGRLVRGFGATQADGDQTPNGQSLYQIGSLTKVFTGVALARLEIDGTVTASDPVAAILGADVAEVLPVDRPTLGELITHHAGLPAFPTNMVDRDQDGMRDASIDPLSPAEGYSRENLREFLAGWTASTDAPYQYSNVGIGLVALALQDLNGGSGFHLLLHELVLQDLSMDSTWGEVDAIPADEMSRLVQGYARDDNGARFPGRPGEMGVLAGAGEIVMSGDDMEKFLAAALGLDETLLPLAEAIEHAFTPWADGPGGFDIGHTIEIEQTAEGAVYRKGGNTSSYTAYLMLRPNSQTGVAIMSSCGGFMVRPLAEQLFAAVETTD